MGDTNEKAYTIHKGVKEFFSYNVSEKNKMAEIINITSTLEEITYYTLESFKKARIINIGKGTTSIDKESFNSLPLLEEINVDKENPKYSSKNGLLYSKTKKVLIRCPVAKKGEVELPEVLQTIQMNAFRNCDGITKLNLPSRISSLNSKCFYNCTSLKEIALGSGFKKLGSKVFYHCDNVESIKVDNANKEFLAEDDALYNKDKTRLIFIAPKKEGSFTIPSTVKEIDDNIFLNSNLEEINIPYSVDLRTAIKMDNSLFGSCKKLKKLYFEDEDITLKVKWFFERYVVNKDVIKNIVTSFTPKNLVPALKAESLPFICDELLNNEKVDEEWKDKWLKYFKRQRSSLQDDILTNMNLLRVMTKYSLLTLDDVKYLLDLNQYSENVAVNGELLDYENRCFSIEEREKHIEKEITQNTNTVTYLKKIWSYRVNDENKITLTSYKGTDIDIIVPDKIGKREVSEIDDCCFDPESYNVNSHAQYDVRKQIRSIIIPDTVTNINYGAFWNLVNLSSITLPATSWLNSVDSYYGYYSYLNVDDKRGIFLNCYSLKELVMKEGITKILQNSFYKTPALQKITLPPTLESIEMDSFMHCLNLEEVVFPSSLRYISSGAFNECMGLKKITLNEGLVIIGPDAFRNCKLKEVIIPSSVTNISTSSFDENVTFKGNKGSYAESFAITNGYNFVEV